MTDVLLPGRTPCRPLILHRGLFFGNWGICPNLLCNIPQ